MPADVEKTSCLAQLDQRQFQTSLWRGQLLVDTLGSDEMTVKFVPTESSKIAVFTTLFRQTDLPVRRGPFVRSLTPDSKGP
jgi:hypothetical protein